MTWASAKKRANKRQYEKIFAKEKSSSVIDMNSQFVMLLCNNGLDSHLLSYHFFTNQDRKGFCIQRNYF